mgnify:CR=1 FL=1
MVLQICAIQKFFFYKVFMTFTLFSCRCINLFSRNQHWRRHCYDIYWQGLIIFTLALLHVVVYLVVFVLKICFMCFVFIIFFFLSWFVFLTCRGIFRIVASKVNKAFSWIFSIIIWWHEFHFSFLIYFLRNFCRVLRRPAFIFLHKIIFFQDNNS